MVRASVYYYYYYYDHHHHPHLNNDHWSGCGSVFSVCDCDQRQKFPRTHPSGIHHHAHHHHNRNDDDADYNDHEDDYDYLEETFWSMNIVSAKTGRGVGRTTLREPIFPQGRILHCLTMMCSYKKVESCNVLPWYGLTKPPQRWPKLDDVGEMFWFWCSLARLKRFKPLFSCSDPDISTGEQIVFWWVGWAGIILVGEVLLKSLLAKNRRDKSNITAV